MLLIRLNTLVVQFLRWFALTLAIILSLFLSYTFLAFARHLSLYSVSLYKFCVIVPCDTRGGVRKLWGKCGLLYPSVSLRGFSCHARRMVAHLACQASLMGWAAGPCTARHSLDLTRADFSGAAPPPHRLISCHVPLIRCEPRACHILPAGSSLQVGVCCSFGTRSGGYGAHNLAYADSSWGGRFQTVYLLSTFS